jgi:hypothetical protein
VSGGISLVGFLWFGVPWITNGRPNIAGQLAVGSPRAPEHSKVLDTIGRFFGLQYAAIWVAAIGAVVVAVVRREWVVLTIAGGTVLWVAVEIAFAVDGFPALPRYMFEAGAGVAVLAGIGVGRALSELPRVWPSLPSWSGVPIVVALVVALVPGVVVRVRTERQNVRHERDRTTELALLQTTIHKLGGYRHLRACGQPVTDIEYTSALAWLTRLDVGSVGYRPARAIRRGRPIVVVTPVSTGGWRVRPWHTSPQQRARCAGLDATYLITKQAPAGTLIHR